MTGSAGRVASIAGRLVLRDSVVPGHIEIRNGRIAHVVHDARAVPGPYIAPGYIDVHVHGWAGATATDGPDAIAAMARALIAHGVTGFLPTAVSADLAVMTEFARDVARRLGRGAEELMRPPHAAAEAEVLGANLEGPFLAPSKAGAHDPSVLRVPADVDLAMWLPGLAAARILTAAPELPGADALIRALVASGVVVSLGHSAASSSEASAGFAAGARSTTHLFNAMTGLDHRAPGLAAAALAHGEAYVELIADGWHVDRLLWPIVFRLKRDRVLLVSDALPLGGSGQRTTRIGPFEVTNEAGRGVITESTTLAGSVIALDVAVRNVVASGVPLEQAVAGASANPATLLGFTDRGVIAVGRRADLVLLNTALDVTHVMQAGRWVWPHEDTR